MMSADVLDQINNHAEREGITRSSFHAQAAKKNMAAQGAPSQSWHQLRQIFAAPHHNEGIKRLSARDHCG
jgi:hypothetical protein